MRVTFLGHAGLFVETRHATVLCDPWLSGPAHHGSWWPFPDSDGVDRNAIARPTYLYVSHLHMDHYDATFLRDHVSREAAVLLPDYPLGSLEKELRGLGFERFVPTRSGEPFDLDGIRLTILTMVSPADGPIGDSGLVVEADGFRLFNQNDSRPPIAGLDRMGHVDAHFLQFSGAIGYPFLQGYPEKMRVALGRRKRLVSMERARRYAEAVGADAVFPSSGPPCFLDPKLAWLNDLGDDDGNVFPDQSHFLNYMAGHRSIRPRVVVPGAVVEMTRSGTHVAQPMTDDGIHELFTAAGKRRHLDAYRERKRPLMERVDDSLVRGDADIAGELQEWWEPLLASADTICAGVNGRVAIDFDDAPGEGLVVDFHERTVRPWSPGRGDEVAHHFTFPRALVVDCVLGRRENWNTDLLLSFRFQERSRAPFNKYLFAFLSALSPERIEYVEHFYRREALRGSTADRSFFQMDLGGRRHIVQQRCPHDSGDLARFLEYDQESDTLTCTLHGWQWRRDDGTCLTADGHPLYVRPADVSLQCAGCSYLGGVGAAISLPGE